MTTQLATAKKGESSRVTLATFPGANKGDPPIVSMVRRDRDGDEIRSFLTKVVLDPDKDHVYHLPGYVDGKWTKVPHISARGYDFLNQFGNVTFLPAGVIQGDDGKDWCNPRIERDGNKIVRVTSRQIAVGMTVLGALAIYDMTMCYDLSTYFCQDLYSKFTGKKSDASKQWGKLHDQGDPVAEGWKAVDLPNDAALHVDLSHEDVITVFGEHISRQKFAIPHAITICRRNILKRHFAASKLDKSLSVPVVYWPKSDRTMEQIRNLSEQAATGPVVIDGKEHDVAREVLDVETNEEVDAGLAGEEGAAPQTSPEDAPASAPVKDIPPGKQGTLMDTQKSESF